MAEQKHYGLGFSPIKMENVKKYAFTEEITANKDVGMFGIVVNDDKDIVSHEYLVRSKHHLETFETRLLQDNTLGKLYKITVNDFMCSIVRNDTTNLVADSNLFVNNGLTRIKGVRFNFDIDIFAPSSSALVHFKDVAIEIKLTLRVGESSKSLLINAPLMTINTTAYEIPDIEDVTGDYILNIDSITIKPGTTYDYQKYTMALYDILFVLI